MGWNTFIYTWQYGTFTRCSVNGFITQLKAQYLIKVIDLNEKLINILNELLDVRNVSVIYNLLLKMYKRFNAKIVHFGLVN